MERLGPYELVGTLGEGGMGTVYRARIGGVERAVKVLQGVTWDKKRLARFHREVENLARLSHPGVVRIHDAGIERGRPYFAMDLIDGRPLRDVISGERLDLPRALEVSAQVARGVAALHTAGIVHRDLKPDNIMLTGDGRAVVLDLGLAIAPEKDERLTQTGAMLGTLSYMAPEQVAGKKEVHAQTDVYALGLILFELVTGETSVPAASSQLELIGKILNTKRPLPSAFDAGLPLSLDRVFARSVSRQREERFADASAFADAVESVLASPGISRRSARRRGTAILAVLILAASLAGIAAWPAGGPADGPAAVASDAPAGLTGPQRKVAAQRLAELRSMRDAHERARSAELWLERYASLTAADDVRAIRDAARLEFPERVVVHPGDARGWFLAGDRLLTIGSDKTARIWSRETGAELHRVELGVVPKGAAVTADRKSFVLQVRRRKLWWISAGGRVLNKLSHKWERPLCLTINSKNHVAVGGLSQWAHVLDMTTNQELPPLGMHLSPVVGIAYSSDESKIVTITAVDSANPNPKRTLDNQVRVFQTEAGLLALSIPLTSKPSCVVSSKRRSAAVVGDRDGNIFDVDLRTVKVGDSFGVGAAHQGPVSSLALSPDGLRLYSVGGRPGRTELITWDVTQREVLRRVRLAGAPRSVDVSADGRRVLVGTAASRVEVWITPPAR